MTAPRQVLPGRMITVTRRCLERRYFLRPDPAIVQLVSYLVAVGVAKFELRLVAAVFMSNHYHLTLYDPHGRHPAFTQWLDSLIARAANCYRGRYDAFWAAEQVNVVELADRDAVLEHVVYVLANPVAAGLVARGREWPGLRSTPQSYASPRRIERPDFFFTEDSQLPESALLEHGLPPSHAHLSPEEFGDLVAQRLATREAELRGEQARAGKPFLGARGVLRRHWRQRPKRGDKRGPDNIRPLVAARSRAARRTVLERVFQFRRDYYEARAAFEAGDSSVVFPYGTWRLGRYGAIRCHPPPACWAAQP